MENRTDEIERVKKQLEEYKREYERNGNILKENNNLDYEQAKMYAQKRNENYTNMLNAQKTLELLKVWRKNK